MTHTEESDVSRRAVLRTAAIGGLGLPLLAACGSGDGSGNGGTGAGGSPSADGDAVDTPGASLVAAADVPVGGGVVIATSKVVVTQPKAGEFKAFSATCTHRGCLVNKVADGKIMCPCHGSEYSIEDGSVERGPAPDPLPSVAVTLQGDQIVTS